MLLFGGLGRETTQDHFLGLGSCGLGLCHGLEGWSRARATNDNHYPRLVF